jgi:hypothetical protein
MRGSKLTRHGRWQIHPLINKAISVKVSSIRNDCCHNRLTLGFLGAFQALPEDIHNNSIGQMDYWLRFTFMAVPPLVHRKFPSMHFGDVSCAIVSVAKTLVPFNEAWILRSYSVVVIKQSMSSLGNRPNWTSKCRLVRSNGPFIVHVSWFGVSDK